jgi:cyclopropane fatty-acyl-phospholipid synthase-like methyltransferase
MYNPINNYKNYEKTRFNFTKKRKAVWQEIARYLQKHISPDSSVLELGSGYCDFINSISASKKYAIDKYIDPHKYADKNVTKIMGDFKDMNTNLKDNSIDVIFASNFFEHLSEKEIENYFKVITKKLKDKGLLIIIQPNYRLCYASYYDDYTHIKAFSDVSMRDFLISKGFSVSLIKPGFLPFSMKSALPKTRFLVRLYRLC